MTPVVADDVFIFACSANIEAPRNCAFRPFQARSLLKRNVNRCLISRLLISRGHDCETRATALLIYRGISIRSYHEELLSLSPPFFDPTSNFPINIFIFPFAKVRVKSRDGFAKYPFAISILRHPLPPSPPLNLCVTLPLNRTRLLGISNWNYPLRVFSLPLSLSPTSPRPLTRYRIFALPLCQSTPIAFSISFRTVHDQHQVPSNSSLISVPALLLPAVAPNVRANNRVLLISTKCRADVASRN